MFTSFWNTYGQKIKSVAIGAVLAGLGAGITVGLEALKTVDFGEYSAIVAAIIAVLINAIRKFGVPVTVAVVSALKGKLYV
jgi:hypothetical protein